MDCLVISCWVKIELKQFRLTEIVSNLLLLKLNSSEYWCSLTMRIISLTRHSFKPLFENQLGIYRTVFTSNKYFDWSVSHITTVSVLSLDQVFNMVQILGLLTVIWWPSLAYFLKEMYEPAARVKWKHITHIVKRTRNWLPLPEVITPRRQHPRTPW